MQTTPSLFAAISSLLILATLSVPVHSMESDPTTEQTDRPDPWSLRVMDENGPVEEGDALAQRFVLVDPDDFWLPVMWSWQTPAAGDHGPDAPVDLMPQRLAVYILIVNIHDPTEFLYVFSGQGYTGYCDQTAAFWVEHPDGTTSEPGDGGFHYPATYTLGLAELPDPIHARGECAYQYAESVPLGRIMDHAGAITADAEVCDAQVCPFHGYPLSGAVHWQQLDWGEP